MVQYNKILDWENSEKYVLLYHHDEYYTDNSIHLVQIKDCGTMLELSPKTPPNKTSGNNPVPYRTYKRSGLSESIVPLDSFSEWFKWFLSEELHNESFHLECDVESAELSETLENMDSIQSF